MHTSIENGEVYAPPRLRQRSVLRADGTIAAVGRVSRQALETS
jgi:hypothetical protein